MCFLLICHSAPLISKVHFLTKHHKFIYCVCLFSPTSNGLYKYFYLQWLGTQMQFAAQNITTHSVGLVPVPQVA